MMKFSYPSIFNIQYSVFCGSLFFGACLLTSVSWPLAAYSAAILSASAGAAADIRIAF
jgi:hypothetical protein